MAQAVSELGEVALEVGEVEHRRFGNVASTVLNGDGRSGGEDGEGRF
jgi:hypothetical protein